MQSAVLFVPDDIKRFICKLIGHFEKWDIKECYPEIKIYDHYSSLHKHITNRVIIAKDDAYCPGIIKISNQYPYWRYVLGTTIVNTNDDNNVIYKWTFQTGIARKYRRWTQVWCKIGLYHINKSDDKNIWKIKENFKSIVDPNRAHYEQIFDCATVFLTLNAKTHTMKIRKKYRDINTKKVEKNKEYKLCAGLFYPGGGSQALEIVNFEIENCS